MIKTKERGQKNILIMGRTAQTIELSTDLGINYIPCCSIVLMFYNVSAMSSGGFRTTHFKFSTNDNRKHKR